jgi:hypothetical protein
VASDVSISYGSGRRADPLTEREQTRLRTLAAKRRLSPTESYEYGGLTARARHDRSPSGQRVLEDVALERLYLQQPVTNRQAGGMIAQAVADAVAKRLAEED